MLTTRWADDLDAARSEQVRELLIAARDADGWPAVTADGPLPGEFTDGPHLLGDVGDALVAYGHLDERGDAFGRQVAELIVHPDRRGHGHGAALLDTVIERSDGTLRAWSHGSHPAAEALAGHRGFRAVRTLLRMGAELTPRSVPALPDGVRLRPFVPGADEHAVVEVNARAFSWHPEQGAMTVADVAAAERQESFDPAGFLVADDGGKIVGFHWTKVHPPAPGTDEAVGEVYVVGVDPAAQGGGLGKAITVAGLEYLRSRGLHRVILYVEGDNAPAIAVYDRLGFRTESTAVQYERA